VVTSSEGHATDPKTIVSISLIERFKGQVNSLCTYVSLGR